MIMLLLPQRLILKIVRRIGKIARQSQAAVVALDQLVGHASSAVYELSLSSTSLFFFTLITIFWLFFFMNSVSVLLEAWPLLDSFFLWNEIEKIRLTICSLKSTGGTVISCLLIWIRICFFFQSICCHTLAILLKVVIIENIFQYLWCGHTIVFDFEW